MPCHSPPAADDPDTLFAAIVAAFDGRPGISFERVMASHGPKTGERLFAFLRKGQLVMKLPASRVEALIATAGAKHFDRGDERPMHEWVAMPPAPLEVWLALTNEAERFVAGLSRRKQR